MMLISKVTLSGNFYLFLHGFLYKFKKNVANQTCMISYKKRIASPGSMQDTGSLGLVHWDDPEGWYGEGGGGRGGSGWGTHIHPWRMHVDVWQNQYNIVK